VINILKYIGKISAIIINTLFLRSIIMRFGPTELIIILVIIILLFGVGRISKIAGELGSGIKSFKDGLSGPKKDEDDNEE
jgi:sec-independent protein translocase protein TatA